MNKLSGEEVCQRAVKLIEEQLQVLPMAMASILKPPPVNDSSAHQMTDLVQFLRRRNLEETGSGGNLVARKADPEPMLDFDASNRALHENRSVKTNYLRVVISNALLTVGLFFKEHGMAEMRTPEIQFLEHVLDGILNQNTFSLKQGYMPIATFDGLVIDGSVDGQAVLDDGTREGLLEFGDAIALLRWLSRYLRGEKNYVSGGDAG